MTEEKLAPATVKTNWFASEFLENICPANNQQLGQSSFDSKNEQFFFP